MLGHHRPGSEGNLASDLENQEPLDTGNQAQPPPRETRAKAPKGEKPPADAKPADVKPADTKPPADAQPVSDQTNPAEPVEPQAQSADNQTNPADAAKPEMTGRLFDPRRRATAQGQPNRGNALDLVELKDMSIQKLNQIAKDLGVQGFAGLRKQELIFKIL